jgi:hypothetical protein
MSLTPEKPDKPNAWRKAQGRQTQPDLATVEMQRMSRTSEWEPSREAASVRRRAGDEAAGGGAEEGGDGELGNRELENREPGKRNQGKSR